LQRGDGKRGMQAQVYGEGNVAAYREVVEELARLKEWMAELEQRNAELEASNQALTAENASLRKMLDDQGVAKGSKAPKFKEDYSVEASQGKGKRGRGRQSTGRRSRDAKESQVSQHLNVYAADVPEEACIEQRQQWVWRLIEGRAKYVCYRKCRECETAGVSMG
jgi:Tfp pilus assembly protein FimV